MSDAEKIETQKVLLTEQRDAGEEPAIVSEQLARLVIETMESHYGPIDGQFRETAAKHVSIDIHVIPPNEKSDRYTLFTTGMSALPMKVPEDYPFPPLAELVLRVPASWAKDPAQLQTGALSWPVRWLRDLARMPHQYGSWLGEGHTVPNGDPPHPLAAHPAFAGCSTVPGYCLQPHSFLKARDGQSVVMLDVLALTAHEMEYKVNFGMDELMNLLEKRDVDLYDLDRAALD